MKLFYLTPIRSIAVAAFMVFGVVTARAQDPKIQTSQLDALTARASQTVDVNIDERVMRMTLGFLSAKDDDERKIKELITGLKGIYVKSFEFEKEGEYTQADLESIRVQLRNPAWNKIVNISSKKDGGLEVYLMSSESKISGLAVLATDAKEITVVNIVGPVDLEKLSALEGHFGVPALGIEIKSEPKPKPRKNEE